ncbi:formate-dependent nitrite reductase complex subunit NrfG [Pelotomaculum schinkii]|uniref:Formate-dependent nitrite reductase complex subunit NrfG n=1 Tax=Pelotomaculum schinkii TaxID=78350 RepID=A0A4Y7R8V0_9FIRM|nr:tetratricopeptide repeat protein [Pelotomaculum schinkii]TEB05206.1 formate-dependent nitrite reductase complex subunit NrfG [Pelotomaculum schinkii]
MKIFGFYILLTLLTRNPLLALVVMLLILFLVERRFIGLLPDFTASWRRSNRVRELQREVRVNPANAEAYLELGESFLQKGQYEQALSYLNRAADKMEDHPLFHFYRGASYYQLGRIEEGRAEIEKAVVINPKISFGEPYLYLARIYLQQSQDGAKIDNLYQQLLQYGSPKIHYLAGSLFLNYNDKEKARRLFRETIENYQACRGSLRRLYRRWALLSKVGLFYSK